MITAMQASRIETTHALLGARHLLLDKLSQICLDELARNNINEAIRRIDQVADRLTPNHGLETRPLT